MNNVKKAMMAEVNHREEKRRNVIVFGIYEASSPETEEERWFVLPIYLRLAGLAKSV